MAPTTTTTITTVTAINTLLSVKRQKIEFRFQLFVDHLDISTLVSAKTYVTEDSGLTINRVEKTRDEAMYTCSASNAVGSRSMTAYLTVNGKSLLNLCTDRPKQRRIEA